MSTSNPDTSNPDTSKPVSTRAHRRRSRAIAAVAVAVTVAVGIAVTVRMIDTDDTAGTMTTGVTFTSVSAGANHFVALDANGEIWEMAKYYSTSPSKLDTGTVRFTQVSAGNLYSLALDTTGGVWSWRNWLDYNRWRPLGRPWSWSNATTPTLITSSSVSLPKFKQVSAGTDYALALDTNDRLWGWGDGNGGRIGEGPCSKYSTEGCNPDVYELGSVEHIDEPTKSVSTKTFKAVYAGNMYAGNRFSIGLGTEHALHHWGYKPIPPDDTYDPVAVLLPKAWGSPDTTGLNWKSAAVGRNHAVLLQKNGNVKVFGENNWGQLCLGHLKDVPSDVKLMTDKYTVKQVSAGGNNTAVLTESGVLYMCGKNDDNELGMDDWSRAERERAALVQVGENFRSVSVGDGFTVAIDTSGHLWGWGCCIGADNGAKKRQITS